MNKPSLAFVSLALIAAITGGVTLRALADGGDERLAKAPKAVQESVKKLVGDNKISGFGMEKTLGMTIFAVEVEAKNGREYAFGLDPDGTIAVRWVGLDPSIVPAEVIAAAKKAHPGGKIGETTICNVRRRGTGRTAAGRTRTARGRPTPGPRPSSAGSGSAEA